MIAGLMKPTSGKIIYSNKFNIRYVPDKFQPVNMIAKEYIKTMCKIDGIKTSNTDTIINKWCERFEISDMINKNMKYLSKGTLQKIGIIQAIIVSPDILILDEPCAGLDPKGRDTILNLIKEYQSQMGNTVLFVSHSMEDVAKLCKKVIVMNKGEIAFCGSVNEVYSHGEELKEMGLNVPEVTDIFLKGMVIKIDCFLTF